MTALAQILTAPDKDVVDPFLTDMLDFFSGDRQGHIGFHGYVRGGSIYNNWLATNDTYRSQITLRELEVIAAFVPALAEICQRTQNFVLFGAPSSLAVFQTKTYLLLNRIAVDQEKPPQLTIADISYKSYEKARRDIDGYDQRFSPSYLGGNFFAPLSAMPKNTTIYVPGITLTNPPLDLIKNGTDNIMCATLKNFRQALGKGDVVIFTYANNGGIDTNGSQVKAYYDHPLIHQYQQTIFQRVADELKPTGNFDPTAFRIHHEWNADQHVLTRHATITKPMNFDMAGFEFDLSPETFLGYMANNVRPPDQKVEHWAKEAGFNQAHIFGLPGSSLRIAALVV